MVSYVVGGMLLRLALREGEDAGLGVWDIIAPQFDYHIYSLFSAWEIAFDVVLIWLADVITPKKSNVPTFLLVSALAGAYDVFMTSYHNWDYIDYGNYGPFENLDPHWVAATLSLSLVVLASLLPAMLLIALKLSSHIFRRDARWPRAKRSAEAEAVQATAVEAGSQP
jgi:hypothetical protein